MRCQLLKPIQLGCLEAWVTLCVLDSLLPFQTHCLQSMSNKQNELIAFLPGSGPTVDFALLFKAPCASGTTCKGHHPTKLQINYKSLCASCCGCPMNSPSKGFHKNCSLVFTKVTESKVDSACFPSPCEVSDVPRQPFFITIKALSII